MATVLRVGTPGKIKFSHIDAERVLADGEIRVEGLISAISHGTELNHLRGTSPFVGRRFDEHLRAFVPAEESEPDASETLGYEMVGLVVEVGPGVAGIAPGNVVHTGTPHQDRTIVDVTRHNEYGYPVTVLPPNRSLDPALFISLGSVALQAVHDAHIKVGDRVLVSGLGTIGLLVTQLVALNGASEIIVSDPVASRRALAVKLGATLALDPGAELESGGIAASIKRRYGAVGTDVAIETSGVYAALHAAIASVGVAGRIVSVGFYQGDGRGLRLGEEWHHNRPELVSSMGVWGCPHRDFPLWDRRRLADQVRDLLYDGRIDIDELLTQKVGFGDAQLAYDLIESSSGEVLKIALTYDRYQQYAANGSPLP